MVANVKEILTRPKWSLHKSTSLVLVYCPEVFRRVSFADLVLP